MTFTTRPMKWSHCNEDGPLSETATEIEIVNEGAGEFLSIYQDVSTVNGKIAIAPEEWPTLLAAIEVALQEIAKHQDTP